MKKILLVTTALMSSIIGSAQMSLTGEYRPRAMYNHGYIKPLETGENPGFFVSQRTRLNFGFKKNKIDFGVSLQDVRVWGDESQIIDNPSLGLYNGWASIKMGKNWKAKIGRQSIILDDSRMFASLDWAQQGRAHDALLFKYQNDSAGYKLDIGLAYNQNGAGIIKQAYSGNYYTNMEYIYLKKDRKKISYSLLALNDGYTASSYSDVRQRYTFGGNLWLKGKKLKVQATGFYQTGESTSNSISGIAHEGKKINAYMFAVKATYPINKKSKISLAFDQLSGASSQTMADANYDEVRTFAPMFGLNHAYYGHMDNFYVAGFSPSTGLNDITLAYKHKLTNKVGLNVALHTFGTQTKLQDNNSEELSSYLGNEIDINTKIKIEKSTKLIIGYSHFFKTKTMTQLRGGDILKTSNWAWLMLVMKPKFL